MIAMALSGEGREEGAVSTEVIVYRKKATC